jgi:putative NADH-flavin reductase
MRVVVLGATGGIGRSVVDAARAAGHEVVAFGRDPSRLASLGHGVVIATGDATDGDAVARSLVGADAVINALGPTTRSREEVSRFETIARNLIAGMRGAGVRRLVDLGGAGITLRDEHKPLGGRIASLIVRAIVPHVVAAKQREYEIIADSDLDWTIVRPPRVTERPATGRTTAGERLAGRSITRDDLARFMVEQLTDTTYVRKAPFVSS